MDATKEMWSKVFGTNLESRFIGIREFKEAGLLSQGSAVCFTNGSGAYGPMPTSGVFYVTECALLGMTVLLARELGADGIRVNAVAPGPVRTRYATSLWKKGNMEERNAKGLWLGRIGEPVD